MKFFREIIGHRRIVRLLKNAVVNGRTAHAYLFSGPAGVGKETVALAFARALLCAQPQEGDACGSCRFCRQTAQGSHPDLHIVRPAPQTIRIEQMRELQRTVALTPYSGLRHVCLVERCEAMTQEAASSFLKTLEEPSAQTVFILLAEQPQRLLPTIVSRCQQIAFTALALPEVVEGLLRAGFDRADAELAAALSGGSLGVAVELASGGGYREKREKIFTAAAELARATPGEACRLAQSFGGEREESALLLDMLLLWYRDLLVYKEANDEALVVNRDFLPLLARQAENYTTFRIIDIIYKIEQARGFLRANANQRLTVEVLFMELGRRGENALSRDRCPL